MDPQAVPQPAPAGGQPVTIDAVVQLLRDDEMRGFRIDVETDSMVEADQQAEKQAATEIVTAIGQFFTQFGPIVQVMPQLAPLAGGILQFAFRRYKAGQELEDLVEKTMASVSEALGQPKPPQPHPDELIKLEGTKAKVAAEIQKAQIGVQAVQVKAQADMQRAQVDHQGNAMDAQHAQAEHGMKMDQMAAEHQVQMAALRQEIQLEREQHAQKLEQIKAQAKAKETP